VKDRDVRPGTVAIVPAAGRGTRLGGPVPKQYRLVAGRPVLWHTLKRLESSPHVDGVVLVVRPQDRDLCEETVLGPGAFTKLRAVAEGGAERRDSVRSGVAATEVEDQILLVHDAVRPLISDALIERVVRAAVVHGAAIPALPATETVKEVVEGRVVSTPDRERLWFAQTPQGFRREVLLASMARVPAHLPTTDEAMVVERAGISAVHIVEGERDNVKITRAADLERVAWSLGEGRSGGLRVGSGYDVHQFVPGRPLILGGVPVPFELGLAGHSDADVLTHAVIDALLGAAGLGDIGQLFPDTDEAFRDISSLSLLEDVARRLSEVGARVVNVDAVVMAQAPRMSPHIPAMSHALARCLDVAPGTISVKATTTEGLGFVGRMEGIAAQAVALLYIS